ncbi:hypothetical protein [Candidatus Solirubrobacter pratensis]|uniref:hypothetical protein n=1 Tax=Candidatus Solirubrobacter pratensis TaxID=1298857 RepID=UPI0012DC25C9|nr:hypothetical protein [Candidatus Solirubrobacter pratensis]
MPKEVLLTIAAGERAAGELLRADSAARGIVGARADGERPEHVLLLVRLVVRGSTRERVPRA